MWFDTMASPVISILPYLQVSELIAGHGVLTSSDQS